MRVLIGCVGIHEPASRFGEGPLRAAIRELEPDLMALLYTEDQPTEPGTRTHAAALMEAVAPLAALPPVALPGDVGDWDAQFDGISRAWGSIRAELDRRGAGGAELHVVLSGAPAIRDAWVALLMNGAVQARAWSVDLPNRAEGGKRCREVPLTRRRENDAIRRAASLFARHGYLLAAEILEQEVLPTAEPERAARCRSAVAFCHALDRWDQFEFTAAAELLQEGSRPLDRLAPFLKRLLSQDDPWDVATELCQNMRRRFEQALYVDCLNRFRRLYEYLLRQVALKRTSVMAMREEIEPRYPALRTPVSATWKAGAPQLALGKAADELCRIRNKGYVNHELDPIPQVVAEGALRLAPLLMDALLPADDPSADERLRAHPLDDLSQLKRSVEEL